MNIQLLANQKWMREIKEQSILQTNPVKQMKSVQYRCRNVSYSEMVKIMKGKITY